LISDIQDEEIPTDERYNGIVRLWKLESIAAIDLTIPKFSKGLGIDEQIIRSAFVYVIATNLKRRHLNDNQRAVVGGKISKLKRGRPLKNTPYGAFNPTQENIATQLNIPIRNIQFVKEIEQKKPAAIKVREELEKIEEEKKEPEEQYIGKLKKLLEKKGREQEKNIKLALNNICLFWIRGNITSFFFFSLIF